MSLQISTDWQLLEHLLPRRPPRLRLLGLVSDLLVDLELVEQELAELLGAVRVEVRPGDRADGLLEALDVAAPLLGHLLEELAVDPDALFLHVGEDHQERHLDVVVERADSGLVEPREEELGDATREVGVLAGVFAHVLHGHEVHRHLVLAASDELLRPHLLVVEVAERERVEPVLALRRIEQVGRDHRVGLEPPHPDAVRAQDQDVVLGVLAALRPAAGPRGTASASRGR